MGRREEGRKEGRKKLPQCWLWNNHLSRVINDGEDI
jgi:hypothetical protein